MAFGNGILSDAEVTNYTVEELGTILGADQPTEEEFAFMDSELERLGKGSDEERFQRQLLDLQTEPLFFIEAMAVASDPNLSPSPHKQFNSALFRTFSSAVTARKSKEDEADWSKTEGFLQKVAEMEDPDHPSYSEINSYDGFTSLYALKAKSVLSKPSAQDAESSGVMKGTVVGMIAATFLAASLARSG